MSINESFQRALISEASYADFQTAKNPDGSFNAERVNAALRNIGGRGKGFSRTQADDFVTHWKVVNHQPDTLSGFSATLFESLDSPGHYTLGIRGTLGASDLAEDALGIVRLGYARNQIYSLYNYYSRLLTSASETVGQWVETGASEILDGEIVPVYAFQPDAAAGLNAIVDASGATNFDAVVDVAGHSLGGHLALAFSRLFPNWTHALYTYNAPGIRVSQAVDDFFRSFGGDGAYPSNLAQLDNNLVAQAGIELISGFNGLPAPAQSVFIEDQGLPTIQNPAGNHSIQALTDALAVYNLLGGLDSNLTFEQLTPLLEAGSNEPSQSLEAIVNAVGELFGAGDPVAVDDRDGLYGRIQAIEHSAPYRPDAGLSVVATKSLVAAAKLDSPAGLAYRYALVQLSPFAVTGFDYAPRNPHHQLDRYDPTTGLGLTDEYLADRAHLLQQLGTRNVADSLMIVDSGFTNEVYADLALGLSAATADVTGFGPERPQSAKQYVFGSPSGEGYDGTLDGGTQADRIYAGAGNDVVHGGGSNDHIEGQAGNDFLYGDGGADTLRGQAGVDRLFGGEGDARRHWSSPILAIRTSPPTRHTTFSSVVMP